MKIREIVEISISNIIIFLICSFCIIKFEKHAILAGTIGTLIGTILSYIGVMVSRKVSTKFLNKTISQDNKWLFLISYYFFALSTCIFLYFNWHASKVDFFYALKIFLISFIIVGPIFSFFIDVSKGTRVSIVIATTINFLCFVSFKYSFNIFCWIQIAISAMIWLFYIMYVLTFIIQLRDEAEAKIEKEIMADKKKNKIRGNL